MRAEVLASLDQELINTVVLSGTAYQHDNKVLFDMLKDLTLQGNAWEFIAGYNRSKDGRAAWLALKAQAEGPQASETRKQKAYADIAKAHYTGSGRFTLQSYITKHLAAHNVLRKEGEMISENKKVTDFLRGIQDSRLDTAKQIVQSRTDLMGDFTLCQQHMATALATLQASAPASSRRQIGATGTTPTGKDPKDRSGGNTGKGTKRPKGRGPSQDGKNRQKKRFRQDPFFGKTEAEKEAIKAERAAKKAQRQISAMIKEGKYITEFTQGGKKVEIKISSMESNPTSPQAQADEQVDKKPAAVSKPTSKPAQESAGAQFGRSNRSARVVSVSAVAAAPAYSAVSPATYAPNELAMKIDEAPGAAPSYQETAPGVPMDEETETEDEEKATKAKTAKKSKKTSSPWDNSIHELFTAAGANLTYPDKACRITHAIKMFNAEMAKHKTFQDDPDGVPPNMSGSRKYRLAEAINKYVKRLHTKATEGDKDAQHKMCMIHRAAEMPVLDLLYKYSGQLYKYEPERLKTQFEKGKPAYIKLPYQKPESPKKASKK
jgi:hypothetical protein